MLLLPCLVYEHGTNTTPQYKKKGNHILVCNNMHYNPVLPSFASNN